MTAAGGGRSPRRTAFLEGRAGGLRIVHRPDVLPERVADAIDRHRANAARGREACEQWGPASSVSRVTLRTRHGALDVAVKWNHPRGLRGILSDALAGSRAARAASGARRLARIGIPHPETVAIAERRVLGLVTQSFLLNRFLDDAAPLPARMPALRRDRRRRRALADHLGETLGRLHAAGLDHSDLKHSNLLVGADDRIALLDLDTLEPPRAPGWRQRVRALGQLEAYAVDLYPWLPRTERTRFLRGYLRLEPRLRARRRALVADVRAWVERRLASWARKDRTGHHRYPLGPREPEEAAPEAPGPRAGMP